MIGSTVAGSYRLFTEGATSITNGMIIGGTQGLTNSAALTQSGGNVTLGDSAGDTATLVNKAGATWDITDNSGFTLGTSTSSSLSNAGLFEKTGGTGYSQIAASFTTTGTVTVATGVLSINGASNTIAGALTGAGTIRVGGGSTYLKAGVSASVANLDETGTGIFLQVLASLNYDGNFLVSSGATLAIAPSQTLTLTGTTSIYGTVTGAGALVMSGGAAMFVVSWTTSGTQLTIGQGSTYAGAFTAQSGDVITLSGGALTLTGSTALSDTTIVGSKPLYRPRRPLSRTD